MLSSIVVDNVKRMLAIKESGDNYYKTNPLNSPPEIARALGKYQFIPSTIALIANRLKTSVPSNRAFLYSPAMQELFMTELINSNYEEIKNSNLTLFLGFPVKSKTTGKTAAITIEGLLAGAHLGGVPNLTTFLKKNIDAKDSNNTYISDYVVEFSNLDNFASFNIVPVIIIIGIAISFFFTKK